MSPSKPMIRSMTAHIKSDLVTLQNAIEALTEYTEDLTNLHSLSDAENTALEIKELARSIAHYCNALHRNQSEEALK